MPERSRPDSRHGIFKSKFDKNPEKCYRYLHIIQVSLSIQRGEPRERLFQTTRREKIKTFQPKTNVVPKLSIDEPILSKRENGIFSFLLKKHSP